MKDNEFAMRLIEDMEEHSMLSEHENALSILNYNNIEELTREFNHDYIARVLRDFIMSFNNEISNNMTTLEDIQDIKNIASQVDFI